MKKKFLKEIIALSPYAKQYESRLFPSVVREKMKWSRARFSFHYTGSAKRFPLQHVGLLSKATGLQNNTVKQIWAKYFLS